jgi:hypothetical protein
MRKLFAVLCVAAVLAVFSGCGEKKPADSGTGTGGAQPATPAGGGAGGAGG